MSTTLFSNDVILEIMGWCSPADLLQMQNTCRDFEAILKCDSIWNNSLRNFAEGVPAPPKVHGSGNWSVRAYCKFLFGGGYCDHCQRWTTDPPLSFSLRLRVCLRLECKAQVFYNRKIVNRMPDWFSNRKQKELSIFLHNRVASDYHYVGRLYRCSDLEFAREGYTRIQVAETDWERQYPEMSVLDAVNLQVREWRGRYLFRKKIVTKSNFQFLKSAARIEHIGVSNLLETSPIARYLEAFNRDLCTIDSAVWARIRDNALHEADSFQHLIQGPPVTSKIFRGHGNTRHRNNDMDAKSKSRCRLCPTSRKSYSHYGLAQHSQDMHSSAKSVAPTLSS